MQATSFVEVANERVSKRFLHKTEAGWVRRCRVCGIDKAPTVKNFILVLRLATHTILDRTCRDCRKKAIGKGTRICSRCKLSMPACTEFFGVNRGRLKHICRQCMRPAFVDGTLRWRRNHPERARITAGVARARYTAKRRGMEFDEQAVRNLLGEMPKNCQCCGAEMGAQVVRGKKRWASLDRINSEEGYVKGNIAIICYRCNVLKSDGTLEEFEAIARYLGGVHHD